MSVFYRRQQLEQSVYCETGATPRSPGDDRQDAKLKVSIGIIRTRIIYYTPNIYRTLYQLSNCSVCLEVFECFFFGSISTIARNLADRVKTGVIVSGLACRVFFF